ncbi:hypothetical protein [uncultured Shimia sp.]|uniref:hypothetical protein n=1 Tax=uncultured Shimia sp. TaxID=573152 RepID=UPI0025D31FE2|nr:hypothetical protein [uncultured Shimia sp.]
MASETSLIVVTDIHGAPEPELCFSSSLPVTARLSLGDLCNQPALSGEALHHHLFQDGGMRQAVAALRDRLTDQRHLIGLGYSAGGTALWKAVQAGASLAGLICVSSTRLRDEPALPIPTQAYFGDNDPGRPTDKWLATVPDMATVLPNAAHAFYAEAGHPRRAKVESEIALIFSRWNAV